MNNHDRLAVLTAIQKRLKESIDILRGDVEREMRALNESMGVKQLSAKIGDKPIATVSIKQSKRIARVTNKEAFEKWCIERGYAQSGLVIDYEALGRAVEAFDPNLILKFPSVQHEVIDCAQALNQLQDGGDVVVIDGELVDGVEFVGGDFAGIIVGQVKTDDVIAELMRGTLGNDLFMLPEGGSDA